MPWRTGMRADRYIGLSDTWGAAQASRGPIHRSLRHLGGGSGVTRTDISVSQLRLTVGAPTRTSVGLEDGDRLDDGEGQRHADAGVIHGERGDGVDDVGALGDLPEDGVHADGAELLVEIR